MASYVVLNNYSKSGQVRLSRQLFETIAERAINEVRSARAARKTRGKGGLFTPQGPAKVTFRKDGKVDIVLKVELQRDAPVEEVCLDIQEHVASAIQMMCETLPFSIKVVVASLA